MGQIRATSGLEFEELTCKNNGWLCKSVKPRIHWIGKGRTNWDKIKNIDFKPELFLPDMVKSKFNKYDAITHEDDKIEIKKYTRETIKDWVMYSEPIFKIATRGTLNQVIKIFGNGDYGLAVTTYNQFLEGMIPHVGQDILDNITGSNIGIQLIDGFVKHDELEYRWSLRSGWKGFNRLSIEFRLRTI